MYSKEYSSVYWIDVEIWEEGHDIVAESMPQNISGRTKKDG
jgi:hypothetical protein